MHFVPTLHLCSYYVGVFLFNHFRFLHCNCKLKGKVHAQFINFWIYAKMEERIFNQLDRIERNSLLASKNVLCLEDVALLTGLSKSWLYKATCSHSIPFYRPNGKQIYFDRTEVENWMKQNRVATKQEIEQKATNYVVTGKLQRKGGTK